MKTIRVSDETYEAIKDQLVTETEEDTAPTREIRVRMGNILLHLDGTFYIAAYTPLREIKLISLANGIRYTDQTVVRNKESCFSLVLSDILPCGSDLFEWELFQGLREATQDYRWSMFISPQ